MENSTFIPPKINRYKFAKKGKLWGLMDQNKNLVVQPQFEDYYNHVDQYDKTYYMYPDNM